MNPQTTLWAFLTTVGLFTIAYVALRSFRSLGSRGLSYALIESSCYRYMNSTSPGSTFYKVGLLVQINKPFDEMDVNKLEASLSGAVTEKKEFKVTKDNTGTFYYLNVAFTLKETAGSPSSAGSSPPGAGLSFSFDIELVGEPPISIPPVDIIPIEVPPC